MNELEHIIEEKECINNFLDHFELFNDEIANRRNSIDLNYVERIQLHSTYLNQQKDTL